jgi:hypothetical protein
MLLNQNIGINCSITDVPNADKKERVNRNTKANIPPVTIALDTKLAKVSKKGMLETDIASDLIKKRKMSL